MKKGLLTILSLGVGAVGGAIVCKKVEDKIISVKEQKVDKFKSYYNILIKWMQLKQDKKQLKDYLSAKGYQSVAIYGMGELGNCLYAELKKEGQTVAYAIDQNASSTFSDIEVYGGEDTLPKTDAIIVTAVFAFDEIVENLSDKTDAAIISLEDMIYDI